MKAKIVCITLALALTIVIATPFSLLGLSTPVSAQTNLVKNAGFENPDNDDLHTKPDYWTRSATANTAAERDMEPLGSVYAGKYSAHLHGFGDASLSQSITSGVDGGKSYRFSFWVKGGGGPGVWRASVEWYAGDNFLAEDTGSGDHGPFVWRNDSMLVNSPVGADWAKIVFEFEGGGDVSSSVWFDDAGMLETAGGCFIATAAYGTSTAAEIDVLRSFRDEVLLQNSLGSQFVNFYYEVSPPVADFISENDVLKTLVRELLVDPVVWVVEAIGSLWRN